VFRNGSRVIFKNKSERFSEKIELAKKDHPAKAPGAVPQVSEEVSLMLDEISSLSNDVLEKFGGQFVPFWQGDLIEKGMCTYIHSTYYMMYDSNLFCTGKTASGIEYVCSYCTVIFCKENDKDNTFRYKYFQQLVLIDLYSIDWPATLTGRLTKTHLLKEPIGMPLLQLSFINNNNYRF
jgi:hypothetical protein